ncbi:hypothetical protein GACE_1706 [Geoglobus acetivorans]|uniref:Uncharacterized protein n=1 Tax=Geoglobus acetivorans TaxID=565033 RepID=A0A0A7GIF5_GEOAI|nr:hypothetical protein GACE_1706 [Geoglobus acetivorans]
MILTEIYSVDGVLQASFQSLKGLILTKKAMSGIAETRRTFNPLKV